jgi:diguanylate cyclase (GGDEF)-like protein
MFVGLMFLLLLLFAVVVFALAKMAVLQFEQRSDRDILRVKEGYLGIIRQKDALAAERAGLQIAAEKLLVLYDLMRELTRAKDAAEAFRTFKAHVHRRMPLEDCLLVEKYLKDVLDFPLFEGYRLFSLKAKRRILGELAYKGIAPADEEAFLILAHQFALALRRIDLCREQEALASTDGLTGLYTRRYLLERLDEQLGQAKSRGTGFAVLMIDVDHFKKVNDEYGHWAGDQVLREISRRINLNIRAIDSAGRFGGEEFCVVLPESDKAGAMAAAERIRAAVNAENVCTRDADLRMSVSVGAAAFPQDARQKDELLDKADWALYRAKKQGRNCVAGFSMYPDEERA